MIRRYIATAHAQFSCRCGDDVRQQLRACLERGEFGQETRPGFVWCRKSEKGAISVYGLRRFPITLYCDQWLRVLDARLEIEEFIKENDVRLEKKGGCVPKPRPTFTTRPFRESVGADNIIRPMAARALDR